MKDKNLAREIKLKICTTSAKSYKDIEELNLTNINFLGNVLNINLKELVALENLKSLSLKFFDITDEVIDSINKLNNLNKLEFYMCEFKTSKALNPSINDLTFYCCNKLQKNIFKENITMKRLELTKSGIVDFSNLDLYQNLKELKVRDCDIISLQNISKLTNLEYIYLNNTELQYDFDINHMKNLKLISFNGSKTPDKELYIHNLKEQNENIKIEWREDDLPIE
ncbi:MAG: hypothetical protein IJH76_06500 [Clostridia bacterium]|nr:hypothetical protein [Clostridia bacterium]